MGKIYSEPFDEVEFRCADCGHGFTAEPEITEDDETRPWHPFFYTCTCPVCHEQAEQDPRQRGLIKAHAHATGPRTPEGIAAVTKNLEGHPTPEEAKKTRLNAMKHGRYARGNYFPSKPGKYARCNSCDYYGDVCIEHPPAFHKNPPACLARTELLLRHQIAFESGDPSMLTDLRAEVQAGLQGLIDEMILQIAEDGGPRIKEIQWYYDKDGGFHLAEYEDDWGIKHQVTENKAHPLLKPLIDFVSKNSLTLSDMGMTPKVQQESELLSGHLKEERDNQETTLEHKKKQTLLLEQLAGQIANSQKSSESDEVYLEYQQGDTGA